jgi:hypothetical protein
MRWFALQWSPSQQIGIKNVHRKNSAMDMTANGENATMIHCTRSCSAFMTASVFYNM